jgi:hypothetical protein
VVERSGSRLDRDGRRRLVVAMASLTVVVILTTADELYSESIVTDRTWRLLSERFDNTMLINVLITVSNYRMVSIALNALGVQLYPGDEKMPQRLQ